MKRAIVVGSGAGGATAAKELQGCFEVTVLEAGKAFKPFSFSMAKVERIKKVSLFFEEKVIQLIFPAMKIRKTEDKMVLVNGIGLGGTTTISTGNALRVDGALQQIGINLNAEFEELAQEVPITTAHQERWRPSTKRLFEICQKMGLDPKPTPKMGDYNRCLHCGRCVLGCPQGVKWDSRRFLEKALDKGAKLITGCRVKRVEIEDGKAKGVWTRKGWNSTFYPADLVILAAGGFGTPVILQNSGIWCEPRLFVDPVLCVAAPWEGSLQDTEIPMPFIVQRNGFIVSPYFDYLSFFFNKKWKFSSGDILPLMIKFADSNTGSVSKKRVSKVLTTEDKAILQEAVDLCSEILFRFGADKENIFLGTLNAGHPGGMLPLTEREAETFHHDRLPYNIYVADATLFPRSLGNPPILTIMAMAKRVSKVCKKTVF